MKYCPKCQQTKDSESFYAAKKRPDGLRGWCKQCTNTATSEWQRSNPDKHRAKSKRFYENHKEKILELARPRVREWYRNNKEKALASSREWAAENREKVNQYNKKWKSANSDAVRISDKEYRAKNKEQRCEYNREWRSLNIEKARELGRAATAKRRSTPNGRISSNISRGIRSSLRQSSKGGGHWETLVGFTVDQLKQHLEKRFQEGMTWDNYGTVWEIDHKTPVSVFNFERPEDLDFRICWSLKNLQPLKKEINRIKGARIDKPFQPSLALAAGGSR